MVRILIFDYNDNYLDIFYEAVNTFSVDIIVDIAYEYKMGLDLYAKNNYQIIFIDFSTKMSEKFLEDISSNNNIYQRIIMLSDRHNCSNEPVCNFCMNTYKKERVLKPLNKNDVIRVLTNKNIEYHNSDNMAILRLKQIEKYVQDSYPNFIFDIKSLTFIDTLNKPYNRAFFLLIDELKEHKISYIVDENANIKVFI